MNALQAKKLIKDELVKHGLSYKLTSKNVNFNGEQKMFVIIHRWEPSPVFNSLQAVGKANGFIVSTIGNTF